MKRFLETAPPTPNTSVLPTRVGGGRCAAVGNLETTLVRGGATTLMGHGATSLQVGGQCTLVGAGPGDPDLLTLKAVKAIQAATVLLVDDLVNEAIVRLYASPTARVVYVGKRGGCKSTPQAFIEKLIITAALAGERVVRLKGGDPFIFGRGGEEVEALRAAGIRVQVVNGITSGLAGVTSLGVPLTHRDAAHGVVFVTGHAKPGDAGVDWAALAATARQARLTLVIYMGVSGIEKIQSDLLSGLPPETPAAVIQNASLATQRQVITCLGELTQVVAREHFASPCVMVVGDVVKGAQAVMAPPVEAEVESMVSPSGAFKLPNLKSA